MREITFRWKNIDGEWVYGSLIRYSDDISYIANNILTMPEAELISSDTVWQFTWLLDNNGNKIFEWDIVNWWKIITWKWWAWWYSNCMWHNKIKILWNIYDNPDLIK